MSEEVARSIGDVLAENARLRQQLVQAEARARIASAAYHQQQDATREHEARYQAMTERALAAEQDNAALRIAVRRQTEARDETLAINRELNGRLLAAGTDWSAFWQQQAHEGDALADKLVEIAVKHHTNYAAALDTARRLLVAWRAERQRTQVLRDALQGLLDDPYGCPMCDCGRLRNPTKEHWPECPYGIAPVVLAAGRED